MLWKNAEGGAVGARFSPDGQGLAVVARDGALKLRHAHTGGESRRMMTTADCSVLSVAVGSDTLVTASYDETVRIWNCHSGTEIGRLQEFQGLTACLAIDVDGRRVAGGSHDGTVYLWDVETGAAVQILRGHNGSVNDLTFTPSGTELLTAGSDGTVRLWNIATGAEKNVRKGKARFNAVAADRTGKLIAGASDDRVVYLWNQAKETILNGHTRWVRGVAFHPKFPILASVGNDETIRLWDTASGQQLQEVRGHTEPITSVAFSPDGRWMATGGDDNLVLLWDSSESTLDRSPQFVLRGHTNWITCLRFLPQANLLASASADNTVRIWSLQTQRALGTLVHSYEGWVAIGEHGYRHGGTVDGSVWRSIGLCRLEVGGIEAVANEGGSDHWEIMEEELPPWPTPDHV